MANRLGDGVRVAARPANAFACRWRGGIPPPAFLLCLWLAVSNHFPDHLFGRGFNTYSTSYHHAQQFSISTKFFVRDDPQAIVDIVEGAEPYPVSRLFHVEHGELTALSNPPLPPRFFYRCLRKYFRSGYLA